MKEEIRTDEQIQAMLHPYKVTEPDLRCEGNNRIVRVCTNPQCMKLSLICNDGDCKFCGNGVHNLCDTFSLKGITQLLNQRFNIQKSFIFKICELESEIEAKLQSSRKYLTKKYNLACFQSDHSKVVEQIYHNKNSKYLRGKLSHEFCQRIKNKQKYNSQQQTFLFDVYKQSLERIGNELVELKERVYQSYFTVRDMQSKEEFIVDSTILKHRHQLQMFKGLPRYSSLIVKHSKLLLDQFYQQKIQFIRQALNNPKQLKLLYRGSEHKFSVQKFHQKCDNIPNTFVVVKNQFGKTISGFSEYAWNAVEDGYLHDRGKNACLLSIDLKQKMVPISENNLIYCNKKYGPTFGYSADLYISDQCDMNRYSHANFPSQYNFEGQPKYKFGQQSYQIFSGAIENCFFQVVEYEVFQVIY